MKCEACRAFYLFFRNEFNKFNNTRENMLDNIYKTVGFCHMSDVKTSFHNVSRKSVNH